MYLLRIRVKKTSYIFSKDLFFREVAEKGVADPHSSREYFINEIFFDSNNLSALKNLDDTSDPMNKKGENLFDLLTVMNEEFDISVNDDYVTCGRPKTYTSNTYLYLLPENNKDLNKTSEELRNYLFKHCSSNNPLKYECLLIDSIDSYLLSVGTWLLTIEDFKWRLFNLARNNKELVNEFFNGRGIEEFSPELNTLIEKNMILFKNLEFIKKFKPELFSEIKNKLDNRDYRHSRF